MARRCDLSDVAEVTDSVQNIRAAGYLNGKRAVTVIIFRQPGANIIADGGPHSRAAAIDQGVHSRRASISTIVLDRTTTIRASVSDVERTLLISVGPGHRGGVSSSCATGAPRSFPASRCRSR